MIHILHKTLQNYLHIKCIYVTYNVHICSYAHIHKLAKQGGGVHQGDLGQVADHPLYILQLQNHPHPLPAPGGCTPYLEAADIHR